MIEAYAFFAAFPVQILAMSVLYPAWFIRRARTRVAGIPAERFAQLYPGVDLHRKLERFLTRYRALNAGIAVLGLLLLGWLFSPMRHPDWDVGSVKALVSVYFMVQVLPICFIALLEVRGNKVLKRALPQGKRTAILQRRGLFDFVSPFVVFLAVSVYVLFIAFVIYIQQHPFPGFAGIKSIVGITLCYALVAFVAYTKLYGRKNPLETHEDRAHMIGLVIKTGVYTCIITVVFVSLTFTLALLALQRWEPFALSVFFVTCALLCSMSLTTLPRTPDADGIGSDITGDRSLRS
jgi:hypothetical protein